MPLLQKSACNVFGGQDQCEHISIDNQSLIPLQVLCCLLVAVCTTGVRQVTSLSSDLRIPLCANGCLTLCVTLSMSAGTAAQNLCTVGMCLVWIVLLGTPGVMTTATAFVSACTVRQQIC